MTFRRTRCAHCKGKLDMSIPNAGLHQECESAWVAATVQKLERAAAKRAKATKKAEIATTRARKQALKRIPDLIKEAQTAFNAYVRARDEKEACICCGRFPMSDAWHSWDCGHYRSTGSASHLRFNEDNAHRQLVICNRHGAGRAVDYRIGLIARIGLARVEALEADNTPHKWQRDELISIRDHYRARLRELKEETA